MNSDKNLNNLEKQLKTLGQKVRIDILKKLNNNQSPLSFSKLQKEVLGDNTSSVNLSFHLNNLKKSDLISSSQEGYSITSLGRQILDKILSIEQILNKQNKTRMIRTSKYSKELFDINKIEEYLVIEGELDRFLARQIAHEVEDRLSKTSIEYMTAPLMREYINAILLENGLEDVRHKLTRLGTPPFEAFKLFNSRSEDITPQKFIEKLGSDVSEQFLLLNLLPKNLADSYLSGEIALLDLNYWALRPLGLYINSKRLMENVFKKYSYSLQEIENVKDHTKLIVHFLDILHGLREFYSDNLLLGNFNNQFLSYFKSLDEDSSAIDLLVSQILRFNKQFNVLKPSISLDFNYTEINSERFANQGKLDAKFLISLAKHCKENIKPYLSFECSHLFSSEPGMNIIRNLFSDYNKGDIILYNKSYANLLSSNIITIPSPEDPIIILDKILVNLHMISVQARQNDDRFLEILHDKINYIFQLYTYKDKLVQKKLNSLKKWNTIAKQILNNNSEDLFKNSLRSISFFGLNEAILNHCGIELDRTDQSELFALKIISSMKEIIEERKKLEKVNYVLSQPHNDSYLNILLYNGMGRFNKKINGSCSELIRYDSNLSLDKKISLFKKFQKNINGGTLFLEKKPPELSFQNFLNILFKSEIGTISLR